MKQFFFVISTWVYIFFLAGLILHTSINKQYIFNKYSLGYFGLIVTVLLLILPYFWFIKYISRTSSYKILKKKIKLTPLRKAGLLIVILITLLVAGDLAMRTAGIQLERKV